MNNRWRYREESEPILCDVMHCAHGDGQASNGRCPGDYDDPKCKKFITDEEFEKLMEKDTQ
jgi:hypothetical protein